MHRSNLILASWQSASHRLETATTDMEIGVNKVVSRLKPATTCVEIGFHKVTFLLELRTKA